MYMEVRECQNYSKLNIVVMYTVQRKEPINAEPTRAVVMGMPSIARNDGKYGGGGIHVSRANMIT